VDNRLLDEAFGLKRAKNQSAEPSWSGNIHICEPIRWSEDGHETNHNPTEQTLRDSVFSNTDRIRQAARLELKMTFRGHGCPR